MNLSDTLVVLDTCVLLQPRTADVLMDMRAEHLFSLHWSAPICDEFVRNMQRMVGCLPKRAHVRLLAMQTRCPEWEVALSSDDFASVPIQVDHKDRHVAAAAMSLRQTAVDADAPSPLTAQVYLVTDNVRDLAPVAMSRLGVQVMASGPFLDHVYRAEPERATRAVVRAATELRRPPSTVETLLITLRAKGATSLASGAASDLGLMLPPVGP